MKPLIILTIIFTAFLFSLALSLLIGWNIKKGKEMEEEYDDSNYGARR